MNRKSFIDPMIPWEGVFPYQALARFGITPDASSSRILDLSYEMSPEESSDPVLNDAWETLRITRTRLLVDFFCYELPEPAPAAPLGNSAPVTVPAGLIDLLAASLPEVAVPEAARAGVALPPTPSGELPLWEPGARVTPGPES